MHKIEARYYERMENDYVKCHLCPANCRIGPSRQGICLIRTNEGGTLIASEYGKTIAVNIDPIEKKPLYHYKPGSQILSIGPNGCNFACAFCQNWSISQVKTSTRYIAPKSLVQLAGANGSVGVAYTYTEPLIWFEYLMDTARILKDSGYAVVLVSNAYINEAPARELFRLVDAANFDLKSIRPDFYRKICKGKLQDVQRTIGIALELGVHLELTNLIIPGLNDTDDEIKELVDWVAGLNPSIPLHFSRYFPHYKIDLPPTPGERLLFAYDTAKLRLKYVYVGNIIGLGDTDTNCQKCGNALVKRNGYETDISGLNGPNCAKCGELSDVKV
ncbi:MAG: AmmeMemoRadiSam system radical SAM enzyme [candidate division Zixibacteria bacterium RBG_16_53_22]|nr:MAG: AmmeMemoRadiSam system radical SAM enzyme [candidate division Zixibacteria bacterium RBG_16_53_22]